MKSEVAASIVIFIATGILFFLNGEIDVDRFYRWSIYLAIFFTALYFYYLTIAIEGTWSDFETPVGRKKIVWAIQTLQFVLFYSLWILLNFGISWYAFALFAIHLTYLLWNIIHRDSLKIKPGSSLIWIIDISNTVFAGAFLILSYFAPAELGYKSTESQVKIVELNDPGLLIAQYTVFCSGLLALASLIGFGIIIWKMRYNPFKLVDPEGKVL